MLPKQITPNNNFIGRSSELDRLHQICQSGEASILIVYGRRRVGKTELLEQAFRDRRVLKFEGIEGQSQNKQLAHATTQLAEYAQDPFLSKFVFKTWTEFFKLLGRSIQKGEWTVYFEELQWLANYGSDFVAELKSVWDNEWRHNPNLLVILCGSSPSFMIQQVLHSQALYNRSQHELPLKEFSLIESQLFLKNRSPSEILDAHLMVGGIPEYLKWVRKGSSVFLGFCENAFKPGSFFSHEFERIFTSSLAGNKNYKKIVEFLATRRFATRNEILKHLKTESGGALTTLLNDLELCGLIARYTPFNLAENSLLTRYAISDAYLQLYFKFIHPIKRDIESGVYDKNPVAAIQRDSLNKWLGFAFERFCRKQHRLFAKILGFESVQYRSGPFFSRAAQEQDSGFQIDLVLDRADKVATICEIKYSQGLVGKKVINEFENKLASFPLTKTRTIHKVLITTGGADASLVNKGYFDRVITLKEIFDERYW